MIKLWSGRLTTAASLAFLVLAPVRAADEQPGVLWETTSETEMEGMPMRMPPQTVRVCAAKEWNRPPDGGDPSCTTTDFKRVGPKATWTVQCRGEMPMTGVGEMIFQGNDAYTGTVTFTGGGMRMKVKLSGRKIGGCDKPL